ncbi:MAG: hypothetical protein ACKV0T_30665 [Planctomycetales bacterium]
MDDCLGAMLRMRIAEHTDGSHRLYSAARRCVEHYLTDTDAAGAVRADASIVPFPRTWTEAEILARLRDAERVCGAASRSGLVLPFYDPSHVRQLLAC